MLYCIIIVLTHIFPGKQEDYVITGHRHNLGIPPPPKKNNNKAECDTLSGFYFEKISLSNTHLPYFSINSCSCIRGKLYNIKPFIVS